MVKQRQISLRGENMEMLAALRLVLENELPPKLAERLTDTVVVVAGLRALAGLVKAGGSLESTVRPVQRGRKPRKPKVEA